jgi:hypothetical protein
MKNLQSAVMYFHQGWTDIINFLPIININASIYENLTVIFRDDAKPLVDFYLKQFGNVTPFFDNKSKLDNYNSIIFNNLEGKKIEFYGLWDMYRNDEYKNSFTSSFENNFFVEKFYQCYGFDYIDRVNKFHYLRDFDLEQKKYQEFIKLHGDDYILIHQDENRNLFLPTNKFGSKVINLNGSTEILFDYLKILIKSKEIHMIDSVWSNLIYLIDAKFGYFKEIPIYIYSLRGYDDMFTKPFKLSNWSII